MQKVAKERWKPVPGYERYFISDRGRVYSTSSKMILNPVVRRYSQVNLSSFDRRTKKTWGVHQLVALAFIGPLPSENMVVHHKDHNGLNNHLDNLEYVTQGDNVRLAILHYGNFQTKCLVTGDKKLMSL